MGPDAIHPLVLKSSQNRLAHLIYIPYFFIKLNTGQVISGWKSSNIIFIFNKGLHSDPLNYRPVSLNICILQELERIIVE